MTQRTLKWWVQFIVLAGVTSTLWLLASNASQNLAAQGVASGFAFLERPAGFDIIFHLPEFSETSSYGQAFWVATLNTLLVAASGCFLATLIGFGIGIGQLSRHPLVALISRAYVEALRNIPLLLQLFFWYFAVLRNLPSPRQSWSWGEAFFLNIRGFYLPSWHLEPASLYAICGSIGLGLLGCWRRKIRYGLWFGALGLLLVALVAGSWQKPALSGFNFVGGWVIIPELMALVLGLATYTGAFIAEIVRSGILAVPRGQREAGLALGLAPHQVYQLIIIPQAMRLIIPPLTSQFLNLTKNSSLGAAIAYPELVLVFAGMVLNHTGQAIETIFMVMLVYLGISLGIAATMNWYHARKALPEQIAAHKDSPL